MKLPLPPDTFPTLALSSHEKRRIADAAEAIVKTTVEQYNEHLTVDNGVVGKKIWKKIKQSEDVRVYRERKPSFDFSSDIASNSSDSSANGNEDARSMVSLLTFGSIPGNLDDVMYGMLSPSTHDMQLRSAYTENGGRDWSVLASIVKPSVKDPFRDLSVKWSIMGHPPLVGSMMRLRDAVFIDPNGFAETQSGERIGYHLYHSVEIPEIPELHELGIVRFKLSICEVFRQRNDNYVEVFGQCLLNPMGDASAGLAATTTADTTVTISQEVQCAQMKKLTRILRSNTQPSASNLRSAGSSKSLSRSTDSSTSAPPKQCALCNHSVGGALPFAGAREKHCRVCSLRICSRCRVHKTVYQPTEVEKQLSSTEVTFCTRCIHLASSASAAKFAVLDVVAAEGTPVGYSEALG